MGATLLLVALVLGSPVALLAWGRAGALRRLPSALAAPDDGSLLLGLMTLVGWAAWLVFTLCVVAESINLIAGMRGRLALRVRLPWLGGVQGIAAGLLVASLALLAPIHQGATGISSAATAAAPAVPGAGAGPVGAGPVGAGPAVPGAGGGSAPERGATAATPVVADRAGPVHPVPAASGRATGAERGAPDGQAGRAGPPARDGQADRDVRGSGAGPAALGGPSAAARDGSVAPAAMGAAAGVDHLVGPADSLWSLAERWYGDGTAWRRIAAANPGVDPSSPPVGRTIIIPARSLPAQPPRARSEPADAGSGRAVPADTRPAAPGEGREATPTITVRRGDTLSSLALAHLGDAERWPEIHHLNADRIADPDEIDVGWRLRLPSPRLGGRASAPSAGVAPAPVVPGSLPMPADDQADDKGEQGDGGASAGPRSGAGRADGSSMGGDGPRAAGRDAAEPGAAGGDPAGTTDAVEAAGPQGSSGEAASAPPVAGQDAPAGETSTADLVRTALAGLSLFLAGAISGALLAGRRSQLFTRPIGRGVPRLGGADARLAATLARARDLASGDAGLRGSGPGGSVGPSDSSGRPGPAGSAEDEEPPPVDPDDLPPASVVLGTDREDRPVLLDLARTDGWLGVLGDPADAAAMVSSMALSLACTRWSEGLEVVAVGPGLAWLGRVGREGVELAAPGEIADELAELGRGPRPVPEEPPPVTRVILMDTVPDAALPGGARPEAGPPGPRVLREAGVVLVSPISADLLDAATTVVHLESPETARMGGRVFVPQLVAEPVRRGIVTLVEATTTDRTEPAPWWDRGRGPARAEPARAAGLPSSEPPGSGAAEPVDPIPIRPTSDRAGPALSDTAQALPQGRRPPARALSEEADVSPGTTRDAPVLNVLGTVELTGARGPEPSKGRQQCLEYCAWILCHPGAGSAQMRSALMVAEPTRRSNTSRLRRWLGLDDTGRAYLPEAYDGVIRMSDAVGTDWERAQVLLTGGVNRAADGNLRAVLELVRGAPMADAAPGQWHWAEEWRTEMVQTIRDVAVELAGRARAAGDLRTARFALDRALVCCPEDEDLLCEKIRVAHLADDRQEVERLVYITTRMARRLGVDLSEETVVLLQEVMEGHARARAI